MLSHFVESFCFFCEFRIIFFSFAMHDFFLSLIKTNIKLMYKHIYNTYSQKTTQLKSLVDKQNKRVLDI